jgi:tRNA threonylcarbamoyladenosine biosynthesis protein TsaE
MATLISKNPEDTLALGEAWGHDAQRGWVIGLSGDLGTGKTQLVKGLARGLGSAARVHSPTFALLKEYNGGRLPLFHLDRYRLNRREDVAAAGLDEYLLNPEGVTVVEWIERWMPELQSPESKVQGLRNITRMVWFEIIGEMERRINYEDSGA